MQKSIDLPIVCNQCQHSFMWSQAKEVYEEDPADIYGIRPTSPACPRCSFQVSMRQLKFQESWLREYALAASTQFARGKVHCCPVMVWGTRGGFMLVYKFPPQMSMVEAATKFDEDLVRSGFTSLCKTWIRNEFIGEGRARGGVDKERIMVHYDGRRLYWTPVMDFIQVAPENIPEEERNTLA